MRQERDGAGVSSDAGAAAPERYRLQRLLGRGGMGEVYLARDLTLDRDVAIKFVTPEKALDDDARRRLLGEARAAAAVDHPGICAVYDSGETRDGHAYVVMQYVEGNTLATLLDSGAITARDTLRLTAAIADALGAAHRRGLVHRDLKPSNVIVTPSGAPKLLDLGIAKMVSLPAGFSDASTVSSATAEGTIVGTPAYMSPEQVQQRPLDGRSDLFSLGAVLYEGLTGRRAFQGPGPLATFASVLHATPPAPSSLRPELTDGCDALCGRLLAKDPADRFQSAEEVAGAIRLLLSDPLLTGSADADEMIPPRHWWRRRAAVLTTSILLLAVAAGGWIWSRPALLPEVPAEAARWYDRGTEAIREGAYLSGRAALEQAIALFPQHVLAYARLAEADTELDDGASAQARLLHLTKLLPDESVLPEIERLRLRAVRALVLRDVDGAIAMYRELVSRRPQEAGAWLDLGRAQEAAGLRTDAKISYENAIRRDRQYAAAYLRLGYVHALESRRDEALAAFAEAERLYRALSDVEGEAEVLLRRGGMFDRFGEFKEARSNLTRARSLTDGSRGVFQQVRIRLALANVTASEGRFAEAERMASAAVQEAMANGLETVAAGGLVDLAWLIQGARPKEAAELLDRAFQLAGRRGARRTVARVRLQQASLHEEHGRPRESLDLVNEVLPFFESNRYRGSEITARLIAGRAHQRLDELELAKKMSTDALAIARSVKDEPQEAGATSDLAVVTTALGQYPEALRLREQAQAIHRRQGDQGALPFDLANRADLLLRLGRRQDAEGVLAELDAGIAAGLDAYKGRARRVAFLRAFGAVTAARCDEALPFIRRVLEYAPSSESAAILAPVVGAFCEPHRRTGAAPGAADASTEPTLAREVQYWRAAAALEANEPRAALAEVTKGLQMLGALPNDELRWRLAAMGTITARAVSNDAVARGMSDTARGALDRIKASWADEFAAYEKRLDLVKLRKRSGLG